VLEIFALFYVNFCMDLHSVDSNEAMKQGNEALHASSFPFLSSVKRFTASSLQFFGALDASLPLLFIEKHR
jgi:hypothetical protein